MPTRLRPPPLNFILEKCITLLFQRLSKISLLTIMVVVPRLHFDYSDGKFRIILRPHNFIWWWFLMEHGTKLTGEGYVVTFHKKIQTIQIKTPLYLGQLVDSQEYRSILHIILVSRMGSMGGSFERALGRFHGVILQTLVFPDARRCPRRRLLINWPPNRRVRLTSSTSMTKCTRWSSAPTNGPMNSYSYVSPKKSRQERSSSR